MASIINLRGSATTYSFGSGLVETPVVTVVLGSISGHMVLSSVSPSVTIVFDGSPNLTSEDISETWFVNGLRVPETFSVGPSDRVKVRVSFSHASGPQTIESNEVVVQAPTVEPVATIEPNIVALNGTAILPRDVSAEFSITPTSYTLTNAPAGLSIDNSGVITGTPTEDANQQSAVISATDASGNPEVQRLDITVSSDVVMVPLVGQSQFATHTNSSPAASYRNVYYWDDATSTYKPAVSPMDSPDSNVEDGEQMPLKWAELWSQENPNQVLVLVGAFEGGTGLDVEWRSNPDGASYTEALSRVASAKAAVSGSVTIPGALGAHGGAASGLFNDSGTAESEMTDALQNFQTNFFSEIGAEADAWFVNGDIFNESTGTRPQINLGIRNNALRQDRYGGIDWRTGLSTVDGIHLDEASMRIAAQRMFDVTQKMETNAGPDKPRLPVLTNASTTGFDISFGDFEIETVDGDSRFDYSPFGSRLATNVTVYYSINGGTENSQTFAYSYGSTYSITGLSITGSDVISAEITVTTPAGTSVRSDAVTGSPPTTELTATIDDFSADKVIFDSMKSRNASAGPVYVSGGSDAPDGAVIQLRGVAYHDGTDLFASGTSTWMDGPTISSGDGSWSGSVNLPVNVGTYYRIEARVKNSAATPAGTTNRCAVGYITDFYQQSEHHQMVLSGQGGPPSPPTVTDPEALQITFSDANGSAYGTDLQQFRIGAGPGGIFQSTEDKLAAMSNLFAAERPGEKFHFIFHTSSGTGATELVDDSDTDRQWTMDEAITSFALADGQHPGVAMHSWYNVDSTSLGGNLGTFWLKVITGKNTDGTVNSEYDHYFSDIYDITKTRWAIAGPHRFDQTGFDANIPLVRTSLDTVFDNPVLNSWAVRVLEPLSYANGKPDGDDAAHPRRSSLDGSSRLAELTAYATLQAHNIGLETPEADTWEYSNGVLTISSSYGPLITTRSARDEMGTLPAGRPDVYPIYVNGTVRLTGITLTTDGKILVSGLNDGDSVIVGGGSIGTQNVVDDLTTNEVWKDWPLVDRGQKQLEGLPIRGYAVCPDGVIPAAVAPAGYDQTESVAHPDYQDGLENTGNGGMVNRTGTDGTANGDGTISIAPDNGLIVMNQSHDSTIIAGSDPAVIDANVLKGTLTDVLYYFSSPDGATGDVTVEIKSDGGGGTVPHTSTTLTIESNLNTLLSEQVTPDAARNRLEVLFQRSAVGSTGTLVVHTPVLRPV